MGSRGVIPGIKEISILLWGKGMDFERLFDLDVYFVTSYL